MVAKYRTATIGASLLNDLAVLFVLYLATIGASLLNGLAVFFVL
jgi:hypothetical protein